VCVLSTYRAGTHILFLQMSSSQAHAGEKRRLLEEFNTTDATDATDAVTDRTKRRRQEPLLEQYCAAVSNNFDAVTEFDIHEVIASFAIHPLNKLLDIIGGLDVGFDYGVETLADTTLLTMQHAIIDHIQSRVLEHTVEAVTGLLKHLTTRYPVANIAASLIVKALPHLTGKQRGTVLACLLEYMLDGDISDQHMVVLHELIAQWDPSMLACVPDVCALLVEDNGILGAVNAMVGKLSVPQLIEHDVFEHLTPGGVVLLMNHSPADLQRLYEDLQKLIATVDATIAGRRAAQVISTLGNYAPAYELCAKLCKDQPDLAAAHELRKTLQAVIAKATTPREVKIAHASFYQATLEFPGDLKTAGAAIIALQRASETVPLGKLFVNIVKTATPLKPCAQALGSLITMYERLHAGEVQRGLIGDPLAYSEAGTCLLEEVCSMIENLAPAVDRSTIADQIVATIKNAQVRGSGECISRMLAVLKDHAADHAFKVEQVLECLTQLVLDQLRAVHWALLERALDVLGDLFVGLPVNEVIVWLLMLFRILFFIPLGNHKQFVIDFLNLLVPKYMKKSTVLENDLLIEVQRAASLNPSLDFVPLGKDLLVLVDDDDAAAEAD